MYLKSLTLKGFKSFASSTTLQFEPGICAIVGPNGSGKSNVLDALTWVMGEQGAKVLRGGKMEDVIFAGTPTRPALGRAEVTLTIDNSDGALPIDYAEVSITRRMFRDGASEYEINGDRVRLMDVQELLSDSGIGREMHVIVGQGRLAEILESRPDERRAFIEEAAGVLKHRRRKEKALRKLSAMQTNLDRVTDLTGELRRQLKPLGRQAEAAQRAQGIQATARDARLRLTADDVVRRRAAVSAQESLRHELAAQQESAEKSIAEINALIGELEERQQQLAPQVDATQQAWFALSALSERLAATMRIADDRARHLSTMPARHDGPDPAELLRKARRAAEEEKALAQELTNAKAALEKVTRDRTGAEEHAQRVEKKRLAALQTVADRQAGIARLTSQLEASRSRIEETHLLSQRSEHDLDEASVQVLELDTQLRQAEARLTELEEAEGHLNERADVTAAEKERAEQRCRALRQEQHDAEKEVAGLEARCEALSLNLSAGDAVEWLQNGQQDFRISGSVAQSIRIEEGWESALAVALGDAASALTVADGSTAEKAVRALRAEDAGHAMLLIETPRADDFRMDAELPQGARWALDVISVPAPLQSAFTALLMDAVLVEDLELASSIVAHDPRLRVITRAGDARGRGWATGGSRKAHTDVEIQAAISEAHKQSVQAQRAAERAAAALRGAEEDLEQRTRAASQALAAVTESDAAIATATQDLARLTSARRSADITKQNLQQRVADLEAQEQKLLAEVTDLEERHNAALAEPEAPALFDNDAATEAASVVATLRATEMEARLALRTVEERSRHVRGRADALHRQAAHEQAERERAERRIALRTQALEVITAVQEAGAELAQHTAHHVEVVEQHRHHLVEKQRVVVEELHGRRSALVTAQAERDKVRDALHHDEILQAQAAERLRVAEEQVLQDLGMGIDDLLAEYGPDIPLPPSEQEMAEYEAAKARGEQVSRLQPMPFDREQQEERLAQAERDLLRLGKVNPLALEEYAALQERYAFLSTQLEDIKKARKDLLDVVEDVDERIQTIFEDAFHDVAAEFVGVFQTLFPGGEGRLFLTDPDDMLNTGVEVEARPPGKRVKRLSLLSGGEKSLTAIAMLVAIFKARPSPFYILDEVEAALDDTNLHRLLGLLRELQEHSQLLVITHQKQTMDIADVLYGVTMKGDGVTKVIAQRLHPEKSSS